MTVYKRKEKKEVSLSSSHQTKYIFYLTIKMLVFLFIYWLNIHYFDSFDISIHNSIRQPLKIFLYMDTSCLWINNRNNFFFFYRRGELCKRPGHFTLGQLVKSIKTGLFSAWKWMAACYIIITVRGRHGKKEWEILIIPQVWSVVLIWQRKRRRENETGFFWFIFHNHQEMPGTIED